MAKDKSDRYSTAEEFLEDLNKFRTERLPAKSATQKRVLYGVAGLIIAAGLFSGWIFYQKPKEEVQLMAVPSPGLPVDDHDKVQRLLDSAQMHEIVGRLVAPPGSNALDAYKAILEVDPANSFAIDAVERLAKE